MAVFALGLVASACDHPNAPAEDGTGQTSEDDAGHACSSAAHDGGSPARFDAAVIPCDYQVGALLGPATPGTVAVTYAESSSLKPAEFSGEGVRAVIGVPGSVQAETDDGLTVDCTSDTSYHCAGRWPTFERPPELRSVSVSVGDQTWTKSIGTCSRLDTRTDFWLDGLAGCVDPDTVVLEGVLLDYPVGKAPPASVGLFGESQALHNVQIEPAILPDAQRGIPYRPCTVEGNHYACTTIGFRGAADHKLRVQIGDYIVDQWFTLQVQECQAQAQRADIQACPQLPDPLQVEVRAGSDGPLPPLVASASYEGGSPFPCYEARESTRYVTRFLCPAALESEHGEGRYEIVASDGARSFQGVYERRSNGCVVSAGPLVLGSDEEDGGYVEDGGPQEPDAGLEGGDACVPSEQQGGPGDAGADAAREGCPDLRGYIGGPLTPETIGIEYISQPSEQPVPAPGPTLLNVTRIVDAVRAETADGRTIDCPHASGYACQDDAGIVSMSVFIGEQSWTKSIRADRCPTYPPEDFVHFWLDDLAWCVEPGAVVLEGSLLGYDPEDGLPISVGLVGESFGYSYVVDTVLERMGAHPYRPCEVSGNRYRCTTIGYRTTAQHSLRVEVAGHSVSDRFWLQVKDCEAQLLQADVRACPLTPLSVSVYSGSNLALPPLQMTASHAGNAPYPCIDLSNTTSSSFKRFACPAALGSDHGAGVYEVVAWGGGRLFRGTYERTFNGCTASNGPLMLDEVVANTTP